MIVCFEIFQLCGDDRTLLMHAATRGDVDIVKLLLENEADVNAKDRSGETALFNAMDAGHSQVVELLLRHEPSVESVANFEQTKLVRAVKMCDVAAVQMLVLAGADVNYACIDQRTPLMTACSIGCRTMVLELLNHGANVNQQIPARDGLTLCDGRKNSSSPTCDTALAIAVCNGDVTIAKDLLMAGADVNLSCCVSQKYTTCTLDAAILTGNLHMVYLLLSHGASTDHCACYGKSPLQLAISCGNVDVIEVLLAFGANPNATFLDLPALCYADDAAVTKLLLSYGADPDLAYESRCYETPPVKNSLFRSRLSSPLLCAISQNRPRVVEAMLQHGLEPSCKTTALFHSIDWLKKDVVELLIAHGADVNAAVPLRGCHTAFTHAMQQCFLLHVKANQRDRLVDIIECIIPLYDNFDTKVCSTLVSHCCIALTRYPNSVSSWFRESLYKTVFSDLASQRLGCVLLQHGADVKVADVPAVLIVYTARGGDLMKFVHLLMMAGVDFSEENVKAFLELPRSDDDLDLAMFAKRLSTPLSLQEIAIKRVRQRVGAPRLWHKIDLLPLPRRLKQACKLTI